MSVVVINSFCLIIGGALLIKVEHNKFYKRELKACPLFILYTY